MNDKINRIKKMKEFNFACTIWSAILEKLFRFILEGERNADTK